MAFPWDEDDPSVRSQIQRNLPDLRSDIVTSGRRRDPFTLDLLTGWHRRMLDQVPLAEPEVAGGFRGSGPQGSLLRTHRVTANGILEAVRPSAIRTQMRNFEHSLIHQIELLDPLIPAKAPPDHREEQVLELCARGHGELVRIHPFADGNGRMARGVLLWFATRYGLPAFLDLRPRPDGPSGYEMAAEASLTGRYQLMKLTLMNMLAAYRAAQQTSGHS